MKEIYGYFTTILAPIFTVIALAFSIWQLVKASKHAKKINLIKESLSTRFIGEFPYYLTDIIDVLTKAKHEIIIVCDVATYGAFSSPKEFLSYRNIIEKKVFNNVKVEITCFNEEKRREIHHEQFKEARENWKEWAKNPENLDKLRKYARFVDPEKIKIDNLSKHTYKDFEDLLSSGTEILFKHHFNGATICQINVNVANYFWIVDGLHAVFAIPTLTKPKHGFQTYGFVTSDHRLIKAFLSLRDRYHKKREMIKSPNSQ